MKPIEKQNYCEIKEYCDEFTRSGNPVFYRGTKDNYLSPSIIPKNNRLELSELKKIEKKLLRIFKLIYPDNFISKNKTTNDWLLRIKAREYGLANQLIDWANFFHTALEFATNFHQNLDQSSKYVYLWILVLDEAELLFNEDLKKYPIDKLTSSYLLRGVLYGKSLDIATRRQSVQGGNFLVQPTKYLTTKLNEQSYFSDKLSCLKIPVENIVEIRKDLAEDKKIDIESQSLLIDNCWLDSVCNVLNNKFLYSVNKRKMN
jgi:hypothetical protein